MRHIGNVCSVVREMVRCRLPKVSCWKRSVSGSLVTTAGGAIGGTARRVAAEGAWSTGSTGRTREAAWWWAWGRSWGGTCWRVRSRSRAWRWGWPVGGRSRVGRFTLVLHVGVEASGPVCHVRDDLCSSVRQLHPAITMKQSVKSETNRDISTQNNWCHKD